MAAKDSIHLKHATRRADDTDRTIGQALRRFRKEAKLTQKALGDAVNMSFKQIRKYELGENRISASMLYALSKALNKPVEAFYTDLIAPELKETVQQMAMQSEEKDTMEAEYLIQHYYKITRKQERQAFMDLVRSISAASQE